MSESDDTIQERQKKQMFLKEMILDPGHDTAKFSEYICSIRADGGDIDVWTIGDLERIVDDFLVLQAAKLRHQNQGEGYYGNSGGQYADNFEHSYDQYNQASHKEEQQHKPQAEENKNFENPFDLRPPENVSEPQNQSENPFDLKPPSNEPAENPFDLKPPNNEPVAQQPSSTLPKSEEEQPGQAQSPQLQQSEKNRDFGEGPLYVNRDEDCEEYIKINPPKKERVPPTEAYKGILRVNKQESTQLSSHPNPSITICDPTQVKGGIFSSSYVQYTVKTAPLGWTVKRRYNDFFWLRDTLQKLHPGVFIPPIPKKKNKNKFEDDVIRKRMYFFEIFLNACLEQADLKGDKYLHHFLHLPDENQFNNVKKKADSQAKIQRVENLYTASGETMLDMSSEFQQYSNLAEEYCTQTEPIYKKIRKFTKVLLNNMKQTSSVTMELAKCFKDLNVASNKFNKTVPERQSIKFEDTYTSLTKLMLAWKNGVFKEMNQMKNKFQAECKKLNDDLIAKKDRMFETMDINDWELDEDKARAIPRNKIINDKTLAMDLMLVNETQQVKSQNDMVAYLNAANYAEISKGFNLRAGLYKKNFQEFIAKQTEHMTKLHTKWAEIMERCIDGNGRMDISMVQSSLFSMGENGQQRDSLLKSSQSK